MRQRLVGTPELADLFKKFSSRSLTSHYKPIPVNRNGGEKEEELNLFYFSFYEYKPTDNRINEKVSSRALH